MKGSAQAQIPFGWYLLYTISLTILLTWLYIRTGGNLLIVIFYHAAIQPATVFIPILPSVAGDTLPFLIYITVTAFMSLLIVLRSKVIRQKAHERIRQLPLVQ